MQPIADMVDELLHHKVEALSKNLSFTKFDWEVVADSESGTTVTIESETFFNLKPQILKDLEEVLATNAQAKALFEQQIFKMVGDDGFYDISHAGLVITNEETIRGQKGIDAFFNVAKRNDSVQNQVVDFVLKVIQKFKN